MTNSNHPRLGIIGAGSIVRTHLDAALRVGFVPSGICGRNSSEKARQISCEIESLAYFDSFESMREIELDALLIAVPPESSLEVLENALKLEIPILIEKPVALSSEHLREFANHDCSRVIVGFNRRHYSSVSAFKSRILSFESGLIKIDIPELSWESESNSMMRKSMLFENSVHVFDLVNYVFDQIVPLEVNRITDSEGTKYAILSFKTKRGFIGDISIAFGTPENISIKVWSNQSNIELNPLEIYSEYSDIIGIPPSLEIPFKRYVKQSSQEWKMGLNDQIAKPGFVEQYMELFGMTKGYNKSLKSARISDAQSALQLAELIFA
jgi:predicted dehydrogenase